MNAWTMLLVERLVFHSDPLHLASQPGLHCPGGGDHGGRQRPGRRSLPRPDAQWVLKQGWGGPFDDGKEGVVRHEVRGVFSHIRSIFCFGGRCIRYIIPARS